jgi:hypothetical protein
VPLVEQELLTLLEHLSSLPVFNGGRVTRSLGFCVVFCRSLFVLLSFFFWSLCCLSYLDIRILITPLVSSNSSYYPKHDNRIRYKFYNLEYILLILDVLIYNLYIWILWELCSFELRNFPKFTTEAACQCNSSETIEQNFMKLGR